MREREDALRERHEKLAEEKAALDRELEAKLEQGRKVIEVEAARKARLQLGNELERSRADLAEVQEVLKQREAKLAEAQEAQAALVRKERALEDAKRELELTVQKRVTAEIETVRDKARRDVEEELKLKIGERDEKISSMSRQIEELKRKAEQGSQQLQGEVVEIELEALLRSKFPHDSIEPVPKGEYGGDVVQCVGGPTGQRCGTILWESKRTKNWSDGWLAKLRGDQRAAKADVAVIVSHVLPRDIETFGLLDEVWITHPRTVIPIAVALRQRLLEVALARQAGEGQSTKMELVYQYLMGPHFRQRVEAIVEAFNTMHEDLEKERRVIMKQWDKRREQIDRVVESTVGMYGDLQGIAGKTLKEIDGLDFKLLESDETAMR